MPRQVILALTTVAMDGVACYFETSPRRQPGRDACLDDAIPGRAGWRGGRYDFYRDRSLRAWQVLATLTGGFVGLLGILRFWYLVTIGRGGFVPAIVGAGLFTAATAAFSPSAIVPCGPLSRRRRGELAGRLAAHAAPPESPRR